MSRLLPQRPRHLLLAISWAVLAILPTPVEAQSVLTLKRLVGTQLHATVTSVADGDTFQARVDNGVGVLRIRISGIDTPELSEPFGTQARDAARVLLFDKRVALNATDVDRYGRLVAKVVVQGSDAGLELVRAGLACKFTAYSNDRALAAAEAEARHAGRGFWASGSPKPRCSSTVSTNSVGGPLHGNTESRLYHAPSCPNYGCKRCTAVFDTADEAKRAGYRPAADCHR